MTKSVALLGRQPALGLAELESRYGAAKLRPFGRSAAVLSMPPDTVALNELGGTVKLAELLATVNTTDWTKLEARLIGCLPELLDRAGRGKLTLGLSVYGLNITTDELRKTALALKKTARATGRSCRIVPNKTLALSSAQVLHNELFTNRNWELILIGAGRQTCLARTTGAQNITAYAARDRLRPRRDARVGMLPPKLAQIIINLGVGKLAGKDSFGLDATQGSQEERANRTKGAESERQTPADTAMRQENQRVTSSASEQADSPKAVLDPFCGTGVILQEALLMGHDAYGTDAKRRMIDYAKANLDWLAAKTDLTGRTYLLEVGDATSFKWQDFDVVATETYLGRPFSATPKPEVLQEVARDVNTILQKFLLNVARQTSPGFRMCLAVPAWRTESGWHRLPMLDRLTELGYTRAVFQHAHAESLIYHRAGQIVARELVVLIRL